MAYASLFIGGKLGKPVDKYPYKGIKDKKYLKDRDELFNKNGNGWWWYQGTSFGAKYDREQYAKQNSEAKQKK